MLILEYEKDVKTFMEVFKNNDSILIPVFSSKKLHPANNELCIIFVKILNYNEYYILPFNHNDCINLNVSFIDNLINDKKKYVYSKREFLYIKDLGNLIDINLLKYLKINEPVGYNKIITPSESLIRFNFNDVKKLNCAIPIVKLYETYSLYSDYLNSVINEYSSIMSESYFNAFNNNAIDSLFYIEKSGLHIDSSIIDTYFKNYSKHIVNDMVFSEYNIYTLTGRPSNRFGHINFSALNKKNGERDIFNSKFDNGGLILMDFDAYHLRLISKMIGFNFGCSNVHSYFGKMYFEKEELTEEEYTESKSITFTLLYSETAGEIAKDIPFFANVLDFTNELWNKFNKNGFIETFFLKKKLYKSNFKNITKRKLFNYYLQSSEFEHSIQIIENIKKLLLNYNSKLILYVYDSFIFDVDFKNDKDIIYKLRTIMEDNNNFPVKVYFGKTYGNMINIDGKLK